MGTIWTHLDPIWTDMGSIWAHMDPIWSHMLKKCRNCERGAPIQGGHEFKVPKLREGCSDPGGGGELVPHRTAKGGVEPVYINME